MNEILSIFQQNYYLKKRFKLKIKLFMFYSRDFLIKHFGKEIKIKVYRSTSKCIL